jgi:hypothetical protein
MSMNTINIIYIFAFVTAVILELAYCYFLTTDFSFGAFWETG